MSDACQAVAAGSDEGPAGPLAPEARQLATLRGLLIGPQQREIEALRARLARLEDAACQTQQMADRLPDAFSLRPPTDPVIAAALAPLVETALRETLARNPELLASAMRGAAVDCLKHPLRTVFRLACAAARRCRFARLPLVQDGRIEQLVLVHRKSGAVLEQRAQPAAKETDVGAIATVLSYLQTYLRDEAALERYAAIEQLKIDGRTYGIHAGPYAVLISVMSGAQTSAALKRCRELLAELHGTQAPALAAGTPGAFLPAEVPGDES